MLIGIFDRHYNEKKSIVELGHNGRLKFSSTLKKFTSTLAFTSISFKWLGIFG